MFNICIYNTQKLKALEITFTKMAQVGSLNFRKLDILEKCEKSDFKDLALV